MDISLCSFN